MNALIQPGALRPMLQRGENARQSWRDMLTEQHPFTVADADAILALFLKHRIARIDYGVGRVLVKHGAYLERAVLVRARDMANGGAQ
jgi:hypothetical protein